MSVSLAPVITTAGLQAVLNATDDGVQARITHVALGDLGWSPTNSATNLRREQNRIVIADGTRIQPTQLHITAVENGSKEYWVREVGFILDDGTLFAIWSHPTQALAWKAADVDLLLAFDMMLSALPADSVTIDGTGGVNLAPATQTKEGLVRLATSQEAIAGSLNSAVVMSPADSRAHGDARYSRLNHRHPWSEIDGKPATYPASSHSHSWSSITSKPNTFPASSHNHSWSSITNKPSSFTPSSHNHSWSSITGKPSTFPPSSHNHDGRYIEIADFRITSGFVGTQNRFSQSNWAGYNDWTRNYADIFPPSGYTMANLQGFFASLAVVYFGGDVNQDDKLYVRWRQESNKIRVICANSENTTDNSGSASYINYQAIWRR
ncbi:MAG: phage tail protein [Candidatus Thiodiazotropha endolucinida]|nr:phage tail protein [Candidatus Thiodiazotropha taylori]MCW4263392.1 phage tail protein [Candidatus Thiodiazotropha endolucinida]